MKYNPFALANKDTLDGYSPVTEVDYTLDGVAAKRKHIKKIEICGVSPPNFCQKFRIKLRLGQSA